MQIVDAQVHIWAAHTPQRPWPEFGFGKEHRSEPLSAAALLVEMDDAGVDRAVLVPPSWEGDRNEVAMAAAAAHPARFAVMGRFDISQPTNAMRLADWTVPTGMLGIRVSFLRPEQKQLLAEGALDWFWAAAEEHRIPLMVLPPGQLPLIDQVAQRYPGLRLTIDHLAMNSSLRDDAAFAGLDDLVALARHANVAVKATALPCYTTGPYPYSGIRDHIERVFDAFGSGRMFWGTDLSRLTCSYRQSVTHFTQELPFLSHRDKELVMGQGLCRWLGWP
jgi:predicted TIM-barrel fold metal-dependent hydrolase